MLFWDAANLAEVRARKANGEAVQLKKLPTHLFVDSSIEVILNKILSHC